MRTIRILVVMLSAALCTACVITPQATPARDAEAKRFEPVTRDGVIYVYRPDLSSLAGATTLFANDRLVGRSLPGTFFRIIVLPGRTVLETAPPDQGRIQVETHGNDVVFVEMRTFGGSEGSPSTRFRHMPPEAAQAALIDCCWMLEVWRPEQRRLQW